MLNIFPDLLFLSFFAPFILRVILGFVLLYFGADRLYRRRGKFEKLFLKYSSSSGKTLLWALGLIELILGGALILGAYTQIASLGVILLVIMSMLGRNIFSLSGNNQLSYIFMLGISLSLLVSGAGAFAFDLPL